MHIELTGKWKPLYSFWYGTNEQSVRYLLPSGFEPKTANDKAFWNVFFARMNRMRPAGLPVWCGIDSWFIIYSIYVSTTVEASGKLSGLYVVGSQAESKYAAKIQSVMPNLRVQPAEINLELQGWLLNLTIDDQKLQIDSNVAAGSFELNNVGALDFFKYKSRFLASSDDFVEFSEFTDRTERRIVGVQGEWKFFSQFNTGPLELELATRAEPYSFYWMSGKRERLVKMPLIIPEFAATR